MQYIPINLLIVDDHHLFRKAIMQPLRAHPGIHLLGTAPDGEFALQMCQQRMPDVLLVDLHMPHLDGIGLVQKLGELPGLPPRVLILTGDTEVANAVRAFRAGAAGYMLKDNVTEESLVSAVLAVADGGVYVDSQLFDALLDAMSTVITPPSPLLNELDSSERQLLRAVGLGYDNKQIALSLGVSSKTVSNRLGLLYTRLSLNNRVEAALFALRNQLVSLSETG